MNLKSIDKVNFFNKNVFIRCDYNCPIDSNKKIADEFRIKSSVPTLKKILADKPNKLVIATHFGRPKNKEERFSTKFLIPYINKYLNLEVMFLEKGLDTNEDEIKNSGVYFMENVRYHDYETNPKINKTILNFDIYCNEAFSCSHRNHTSITCIPAKEKCFGRCVIKEIDNLNLLMEKNKFKKLAIIGGAKMDDKIPMLKNLSKKVDYLFITGGNINSIVSDKLLLDEIRNNNAEIILPIDGYGNIKPDNKPIYFQDVYDKNDNMIFDMGLLTMNMIYNFIENSDIIFWNGALGITEHKFYKNGSEILVKMLRNSKAKVIIGGGDTAGFVNNYKNNYEHISTGGGASIDYISNGSLVGLK
jgi:3-phosphoglycerate kinase